MKVKLAAWYDLRQRPGSEGEIEPTRHLAEEDDYYPSREDYYARFRGKEARSDSH